MEQIARFIVKDKNSNNTVSIYLDCYDSLGYVGQPYWEVYPFNDDVGRCLMDEVDNLLHMIKTSFEESKIKR